MNTCPLFDEQSFKETPGEVQDIIEKLLEKSESRELFSECRFVPPTSACFSGENRVSINPWNGNKIQFCVYFGGEERHFLFVSKSFIDRPKQNVIYRNLQSIASSIFPQKENKKVVSIKPVFVRRRPIIRVGRGVNAKIAEPTKELLPDVAPPCVTEIIKEVVMETGIEPNGVLPVLSPKGVLPDICKKILAVIEASTDVDINKVPKEFLSNILRDFFGPLFPSSREPKGLIGPTFSLLQKKNILSPYYGEPKSVKKKPEKNSYRLPAGYSINVVALRLCAEEKNEVVHKEKKKPVVARVPKKKGVEHTPRFHEDLGWVTNALHDTERVILKTEQELAVLKKKENTLREARDYLALMIEGFKQLEALK